MFESMSTICGKLCCALLLEHFGPIVQNVGRDLFKNGERPLNLIRINTKLPLSKVKEALCVLIKHGFVSYKQNSKGVIVYSLDSEKVLLILRYSRFMFFVKNNCGDEAEIMFEEILKHGYETASHVIVKIYKEKLPNRPEKRYSLTILKEKFDLLVENQFLMRSICSDRSSDESPADREDFHLPNLDVKKLQQIAEGANCNAGDAKIYWQVNFDRLAQDLRDQLIISAISKRIDDYAGELMKRMLFQMYLRTASWADTSNPIPFTVLREVVKKLENPGPLAQYLEQYLCLIEDDSCQFIRKVGDSSGGQFSINMKEAFNQLAWSTIENIVMERFGSKAARVFRLVRAKKFIEQETIQQLAMTPAKETKQITYTLLQENYMQLQEVRKPGVSAAPLKSFFLFHIDLDQVVRMEIEHCYQALYNTMQKREYEVTSNRRLIDKKLKVDTVIATFKAKNVPQEQIEEWEQTITEPEKVQLEKVKMQVKQLGVNELQIDDTLFLLTTYLRYNQKKK